MKLVSVPAILALCVVLPSLTFAQGPASGGADKARLTKLEKEFNVAKAKLAKSPKDKKLQKSFVVTGSPIQSQIPPSFAHLPRSPKGRS